MKSTWEIDLSNFKPPENQKKCALDGCDIYFEVSRLGHSKTYCCSAHQQRGKRYQKLRMKT